MPALNTCPCCGHNVTRSENRLTVQVDDGLLHLCNEAFAIAQKWGANEVGLAHMAWCCAGASVLASDLERAGLSPTRLRQAAEKAARGREVAPAVGAPRTSAELKTLLGRAETMARRNGRACASAADFLHVLLDQSIDIGSADFVRSVLVEERRQAASTAASTTIDRRIGAIAVGQSHRAERPMQFRHGAGASIADQRVARDSSQARTVSTPAPPRPLHQPSERGPDVSADVAALTQAIAQDRAASSARFERQSRDLAELRRLIGTIEAQAESGRDRGPSEARVEQHERDIAELRRLLRAFEARSGSGTDTGVAEARLQHHAQEIAELRRLVRASADRAATDADGEATASRLRQHEGELSELRELVRSMAEQTRTMTAQLAALTARERQAQSALAERDARLAALEQRDNADGRSMGRRGARSRQRSRLRRLARRMRSRMRQRWRRRERQRSMNWRHRRAGWPPANDTALARLSLPPPPLRVAEPLSHFAMHHEPEASRNELLVEIEEVQAEDVREEEEADEAMPIGERPKRFYLALDDEIERAPSIGPKTAANLLAANIVRVRDLIACDPQIVASLVPSRYVSAERVAAWKAQARLVCSVPWLRGTHAQLLVGAGFDSLEKLRRADTGAVCARILRYAATREGQSVLRSGAPPEPDRVAGWMANVALAEPERAAA